MSNTLVDLPSSAFCARPLKNADVVKWMVPVITILEIGKIKLSEQMKRILVDSTNCCWHFSRVTQTDREYGLMSSSKIGLVKITCHESLHSSHDVEFLHSYQQSYTSTWDKLLSPQCIIQDFLKSYIHRSVRQILKQKSVDTVKM